MSRPANDVFHKVTARAKTLNAYINRMERLHYRGQMSELDLLRAYGGAFLSFHSFVENSIEDLFIGLVAGRLAHSDGQVRPLVDIKSNAVARNMVFGGRSYADWLPYHRHTMQRAELFFSRGKPFCDLSKRDRVHLDGMTVIRNALAHESGHSLKQFRKTFIDGKALPPRQHRPPGYLRGQHAANQSRLNFLMSGSVQVIRLLCGV